MEGRAVTLELLGTNEVEIAYIAGLFDGEGCITMAYSNLNHRTLHCPRASIEMTTLEPLSLIMRIFGGKLRRPQQRQNSKPTYMWLLRGKKMELFLRVIHPYLIIKRDKTTLALSYLACGRIQSSRKRELAELITPHRTKNHDVNPDEPSANQPQPSCCQKRRRVAALPLNGQSTLFLD